MVLNETLESLKFLFEGEEYDDYQLLLQLKSILDKNGNAKALEIVNLLVESAESKQQDECAKLLRNIFENLIYIRNFPEKTHEHNWFEILHNAERDIAYLMIISPKIINKAYIESIWDDILATSNEMAQIMGAKTAMNFTWDDIFEKRITI
jgi:hypothetical protein